MPGGCDSKRATDHSAARFLLPNGRLVHGCSVGVPMYALAHELGHAGSWTTDPGTRILDEDMVPLMPGLRMRNIIINETPIMRELGEPARLRY